MEELHFESEISDVHLMYNMGNFVEAFSKGVVLQEKLPDSPLLHNLVGASELALGDPKAAANSFGRAIEADPNFIDSYNNLGLIYRSVGMKDEALAVFKMALKIDKECPEIFFNIGNLLLDAKMFDLAREGFSEALKLDPHHYDSHYNYAVAITEKIYLDRSMVSDQFDVTQKVDQQALEDAESHLLIAKEANLTNAEYFNFLGEIQYQISKYGKSEKNFKSAIALNKDFVMAYVNLAKIRGLKRNFNKSIELCKTALRLDNKNIPAKLQLGKSYFYLSLIEPAIKIFSEINQINPNNHSNKYNLFLALAAGEYFQEAWKLYDVRFSLGQDRIYFERFSCFSLWDGKTDCNLAIWQEQGVGDVIFFTSLFADVSQVCKNITVFVDKRLISIFQSSYKDIRFVDLETIPAVSDFDAHLPMGSLLSLFRNDKSKFTMEPKAYLTPTTHLNSYLKRYRKSITKTICGISWFTKANQVPDDRKMDLEILVKTLGNFDLEIVNLQYPEKDLSESQVSKKLDKKVKTIPGVDLKNDFDAIASIICNCDFVVTIDNVIAHLASALGKKTFVLLPLAPPNFRWLINKKHTPYYPQTTTLIRKQKTDDWSNVLIELKEEIAEFLSTKDH